jgi:hypothetical protein
MLAFMDAGYEVILQSCEHLVNVNNHPVNMQHVLFLDQQSFASWISATVASSLPNLGSL